ncbi:MAG: carbohydrate-binding protein, partial [Flavisolibacter sp.]|nr:carbohydrate-binding protein [Flavisolibacter sp.]
MKNFTQLVIAILCGVLSMHTSVKAQSILDPSDPIVNYDSLNPPTQPAWGTIGKWVRRPILTWNTESYKAYIYKGLQFRLKFPKSYNPNANDGKKYPILMFWHGLLEAGDIHDNEYSMFLGAELFRNNVDNGNFDGFVIFMQAPIAGGSFFAPGHFQYMTEILDYMTVNNKLDPFHIISNGLSSGGMASWDVFLRHTNYVSTVVAMSAPGNWSGSEIVEKSKFTPIWYAHGGEDHNPAPSTGDENYNAMMAAGANFKRIKYPGAYHDTWGATWWDPEFWPYLKRAYSSNPWALHNKTLFAPGDPVNATIGLAPGYDQYEWRRNGVLIPAASGNSIQATQLGLYDARVRRGSVWSEWSKIPVELKEGVVTPPPPPPPSGAATRIEAESFTTMSGIQSEPTSDVGGGLNIGWQDNGDWLNYSVSINTAGSYTLSFRVASYFSGAQFQLRKEDGTVLTTVTVPNTGGFQNWQTVTAVATLPAGLQTLRIITTAANGGWNFNWWEIPDALNGGTPTNQAPTANAGSAQTITLPTNSVTLTGSGTDPDGTIASYAWTKVSGPDGGTITSPAQASTTVTGLTQGSYTFRLTVTDNGGATGTADV